MIYDDIKNLHEQFMWNPIVENVRNLKKLKKFISVGMGGSHFAADLIKTWRPDLDIIVWSDYGLPSLPAKELKERLVVISSYSGNTEETLDAFRVAVKKKLNIAVVSSGGKLIAMARELNVSCVVVPYGIQPRAAVGYMLVATLALIGQKPALRELTKLAKTFRSAQGEKKGEKLAKKLRGSVPVIYASSRNYSVAYNWKIRLNETGKIPAFYNIVPEMNHNEMTGFDAGRAAALSRHFYFIFLKDSDDHPRIIKRMNAMQKIFAKRGFRSEVVPLSGKNIWKKIFSSIILADWTSYYTARQYGAEPEAVTMIEEFKKLIAKKG